MVQDLEEMNGTKIDAMVCNVTTYNCSLMAYARSVEVVIVLNTYNVQCLSCLLLLLLRFNLVPRPRERRKTAWYQLLAHAQSFSVKY